MATDIREPQDATVTGVIRGIVDDFQKLITQQLRLFRAEVQSDWTKTKQAGLPILCGVGGLALSTRFLQKGGLGVVRATSPVALQQSVQVIVHVSLLIFFSAVAGATADLSHFVPSAPVPFGGALVYVPAAWIEPAEGGIDELMSVYVSMGITAPGAKTAGG